MPPSASRARRPAARTGRGRARVARPGRQHAAGRDPAASRDGVAPRRAHLREARGLQPRRLGEGPPAMKMIEDGLARGRAASRARPSSTRPPATPASRSPWSAPRSAIPVELVMPEQRERRAEEGRRARSAPRSIYSDPLEGSDGAIRLCRKILAENPERYFKPDQYNNPANPLAHYETHRPGDLAARPTAASRTSSPPSARAARSWARAATSRSRTRAIQIVAAEPEDAFHGLEGLKHMASLDRARHLPRARARPEDRHRHRGRLQHGLPPRTRGRAAASASRAARRTSPR